MMPLPINNLMLMAHDFEEKNSNLKKFQFFQNLEAKVGLFHVLKICLIPVTTQDNCEKP